ncbi:sortase [uncultured Holdemanella sp.]|uniref:sortase n=1 Tax=uncultured Holdemanella sp. TaxID=1763549 RepID=UPI0028063626|nr:sortase [uncultured Holdemanella sp.]
MKQRLGKGLSCLGIVLIVVALSLCAYNVYDSFRASWSSKKILDAYVAKQSSIDQGEVPDYILNPDMDMPEVELEGLTCVGMIEIPALDIKLPVTSIFTYELMKVAPCRYYGTPYKKNMVIAAHNSWYHFGRLNTLKAKNKVIFTDAAGNRFVYRVDAIEALRPNSVKDVTSGKWPLTLFTCTLDAQNRVVVRCK